jgi:hypothetical protein
MYNYNEIKEQVAKVVTYSQGIKSPKVERHMEKWLNNKKYFINLFGDNLRWKAPKPVRFSLSEKEKDAKLFDLIEYILGDYYSTATNDLCCFIENMRSCFYDNCTDHEYIYGDKTIKKGTKIIKDFKYFITDAQLLSHLQDKASRLIQENELEGDLYLSVHPLDYLSSAETTHNWRSCHSLDGEHRSGNLSYMLDNSTVVCYVCDSKDTKLPHFPADVPWNSKKWRMLLHFSNDREMLFAGRQYPYAVSGVLETITQALESIDLTHIFTPWYNKFMTRFPLTDDVNNEEDVAYFEEYTKYLPVGTGMVSLTDLITDHEDDLHFCDILYSTCYTPSYCYRNYSSRPWYRVPKRTGETALNYTKFEIGAVVPCLDCGNDVITSSEAFCCDDCRESYIMRCDHCGDIIDGDTYDCVVHGTGMVLCEYCYNHALVECEECGEYYFENEEHECPDKGYIFKDGEDED